MSGPLPKYYLYVSDAKVDMLLGQLPDKLLRRASVELSIDLGLIRAGLKVGEAPNNDRRFKRLQVVINALEKHEVIGSPSDATTWVRGTGRFPWRIHKTPDSEFPALFADGGFYVGSLRHCIGHQWNIGELTPHSDSDFSAVEHHYFSLIDRAQAAAAQDPEFAHTPVDLRFFQRAARSAPPMTLDFMAVVYARGLTPRTQVKSFGSPLYVALA